MISIVNSIGVPLRAMAILSATGTGSNILLPPLPSLAPLNQLSLPYSFLGSKQGAIFCTCIEAGTDLDPLERLDNPVMVTVWAQIPMAQDHD
jgi:hypothetical protein